MMDCKHATSILHVFQLTMITESTVSHMSLPIHPSFCLVTMSRHVLQRDQPAQEQPYQHAGLEASEADVVDEGQDPVGEHHDHQAPTQAASMPLT